MFSARGVDVGGDDKEAFDRLLVELISEAQAGGMPMLSLDIQSPSGRRRVRGVMGRPARSQLR
jgi:hypothetical protein